MVHGCQDRSDMPVGEIALGVKHVIKALHHGSPFEQKADLVNDDFGEFGDIGQRSLGGFPLDPFGLTDEIGRLGISVRNTVNKHGHDY